MANFKITPQSRLLPRREVADEELLGRTPVALSESEIRDAIENKTILVTGAAGSIGSELCRQIGRFGPNAIIGFDVAESALFDIEQEMLRSFPKVRFHAVVGNIQNRARVDELFGTHRPTICYHAAAYKHVPLMEEHFFEAIENNVLGTSHVALAAAEHGVRDFVLISSDKAVRPTSMMGATKRIAELLLQGLDNNATRYIAVRFGNVLGSTGSVLTVFRRQLAAGGPITVTHPDMRRFFMTIPEACQLVLQAATLAGLGRICVLDMGEQMRILDLAHRLIRLSGMEPDNDVSIQFTGIRPGEKLYEELSSVLEDTAPTRHAHVRMLIGDGIPQDDCAARIHSLHNLCKRRDAKALLSAVRSLVPDYTPSQDLLTRIGIPETGSTPPLPLGGGSIGRGHP